VLFSRSRDFIPRITFKDVLRFEERNKNVFFLIMRGIRDAVSLKEPLVVNYHRHRSWYFCVQNLRGLGLSYSTERDIP
jgi:hypothetical protein